MKAGALKIGDSIFEYVTQRGQDPKIVERKIHSIGKKYLYLEDFYGKKDDRRPVDKETLKFTHKVYSQSSAVFYRTEQEILDMVEKRNLLDSIKETFCRFGTPNLSLQQLRDIKAIIAA